jgi:L-fucose isomerase-like protein
MPMIADDSWKGGGMPKRWKVLRWGALGAICGLFYSAFMNFYLLPYAFETFDMTAYLTASLVRSIAGGVVIFAGVAIIRNWVIRSRAR